MFLRLPPKYPTLTPLLSLLEGFVVGHFGGKGQLDSAARRKSAGVR